MSTQLFFTDDKSKNYLEFFKMGEILVIKITPPTGNPLSVHLDRQTKDAFLDELLRPVKPKQK